MSGTNIARGVYKQLRAHDKALSAQALKARERGQAAADAAAALQARAAALALHAHSPCANSTPSGTNNTTACQPV
jgi:hypothetical protein